MTDQPSIIQSGAFGSRPNDYETFLVSNYEKALKGNTSLIRVPGRSNNALNSDDEEMSWTTFAHINSYMSLPGSAALHSYAPWAHESEHPEAGLGFDARVWIQKNIRDWDQDDDLMLAMKQGWFDRAYSPEQVAYYRDLSRGVNDTLAETYKMGFGGWSMTLLWQLGGDPANLAAGIGLAKMGYQGIRGFKTIQNSLALRTLAVAGMGGATNLAFEKALNDLNPSTNFDVDGYTNEAFAAGMGAVLGGGLTLGGAAIRNTPVVKRGIASFQQKRLEQSLDTLRNDEVFRRGQQPAAARADAQGPPQRGAQTLEPQPIGKPREATEQVTMRTAVKQGEDDLDAMLTGPRLEGTNTVAPLRPKNPKHNINRKINQLKAKADEEGWDLQVIDHPDQKVLEVFEDVVEIARTKTMNDIATQADLGARVVDRIVSKITRSYASPQGVVTPGGRIASANAINAVQDIYRTISGSAHTVTQASALKPFVTKWGATAEGYMMQLRRQAEGLSDRLRRTYREARRENKNGINYNGSMVDTGMVKGQINFEAAVMDYIRKKHAREMGYDVEVPTDVHPSIKAAADDAEGYFKNMGKELVKSGILNAEHDLLGRYLPVVFDHRMVRRDPSGFVDRLAAALRERDLRNVKGIEDELVVLDDIAREMNMAAGRDLFADARRMTENPDPPTATRAADEEPQGPPPPGPHPIDERARADLEDARGQIDADAEGRPLRTHEEPASPDRGWDDMESGGFSGPPLRGHLGDETSVATPQGAISARWALVEADDVIPSHDATRGRNAKGGYPPNRNADDNVGRGYSDPKIGAGAIRVVQDISENPNLDLLIVRSPDSMTGPSIVTKHGQVLGGNARMMGTQVIYQKGGANAQAFRTRTLEMAREVGIEAGEEMTNPVLVRVANNPGNRGQLSELLNKPLTSGYNALGEAIAKGSKLSFRPGGAVRVTRLIVQMGQDGQTVRSALNNPKTARELADAMYQERVWTPEEYNAYWRADRGKLTDEGKRQIERLITARLLDDESILADVPDAVFNKIQQSGPRLLALAEDGKVGNQVFIRRLREATDLYTRWKDSDLPFEDFFGSQGSLIRQAAGMNDPVTLTLVRHLDETKPSEFGNLVSRFYNEIGAEGRVLASQGQPSMFGSAEFNTHDVFFRVFGESDSPAIRSAREAHGTVGSATVSGDGVVRFNRNRHVADDPESSWALHQDALADAEAAKPVMRDMMDDLQENCPGVVNLKETDETNSLGVPLAETTGPRVKSVKPDSQGRIRLKDKVLEEGGLIHNSSDLLAGRLVVEDLEPETLQGIFRYLEDNGYRIIDGNGANNGVRDYGETGYHASHIQVEVAPGMTAELQLHYVERFKVLEEAHHSYDVARNPDATPAQVQAANVEGRGIHNRARENYEARMNGGGQVSRSTGSPNASMPASARASTEATLPGQPTTPLLGPRSASRQPVVDQTSRRSPTNRQSTPSSSATGSRSSATDGSPSTSSITTTPAKSTIRVGDLGPDLRRAYLERLDASRRQAAEGIKDAILNPHKGHGVANNLDVPPALRARTLGINYSAMDGFLDEQMTRTVLRYDHQMSGRVGVHRAIQLNPDTWSKYRTSQGNKVESPEDVLDVLDLHFRKMREVADLAGDTKLSAKIDAAHRKAMRDIGMPMKAMLGNNPVRGSVDPEDFLSFMGRTVQRYNFVNKLGSVAWAQLNDFAPVSLHLLQNPRSLRAIPQALGLTKNMSRKDLELLGLWADNMTRSRSLGDLDFDTLDNGFGQGVARAVSGALEVGATKAADVAGHVSGMNWVTNANKRLAGMLTFERMGTVSKKMLRAQALMREGMDMQTAFRKVRLSRWQAAKINQLGLDTASAQRFHQQVYAHGTYRKGKISDNMTFEEYLKNEKDLFSPGFHNWDDTPRNSQLLDTLRSRIDDEVNRHMVVTPGYFDRPLVNFHTWGKLLNQFQTFMMAFQHQRMMPMTQMPSHYQLWYMTAYLGLGALTDGITNHLSGRRKMDETVKMWQDNPAGMTYKAFVYSGLSGPINRVWGLTDALGVPVSPGVLFDNRVGGGASQGFYYGDPGAKTLIQALGPTASSAARVGDVLGDVVGPGETDDMTAYKAATLLPFQNQAILRMLYQGTGLPVVPEALLEDRK